jgi:hypothetical protein
MKAMPPGVSASPLAEQRARATGLRAHLGGTPKWLLPQADGPGRGVAGTVGKVGQYSDKTDSDSHRQKSSGVRRLVDASETPGERSVDAGPARPACSHASRHGLACGHVGAVRWPRLGMAGALLWLGTAGGRVPRKPKNRPSAEQR